MSDDMPVSQLRYVADHPETDGRSRIALLNAADTIERLRSKVTALTAERDTANGYSDCDAQTAAVAFSRAFAAEAALARVTALCDEAGYPHELIMWADELERFKDLVSRIRAAVGTTPEPKASIEENAADL